jgi:flagellar hook-associated protein 1 FlgK
MSDIFNISSAAVSAYQRALGTVSNNIANVGTEGYVRQESKLEENPSALKGNVYLGTGTNFAGVRRAYDEFLEQNLRNSNSDVATQEPLVTYTNRVVDVLGSDTVGLPPAMDKFFASARALSTDPSSTILRGQFLRDTEGLADRFHQLSGQLGAIELETRESINGKIDKINNLSSQLAVVNRQLAGKSLPDLQPPELLDQRDRLLNDLSKLVKISVSTTANGSVNVGIGSVAGSGLILNGQNTLQIGAQFDVADMGRFTIVGDPFGNAEPIIGVGNGELGGLVNFREQVLQPSVEHLDFLAKTLANEVNAVQRNGIDTHGELGKDLFVISTVPRTDKASGAVTQIERAAEGLKVAITDTSRIAAGARFRVIENEKNLSGVDAALSYAPSYANTTNVKPLSQVIKNNPDPSAGIAAPENLLLGQITQGSDNWSLF